MRIPYTLALGLVFASAIYLRLEANDGILARIHRHGDCDAKPSVVRLPAQEIRIETTKPRVIVNEFSAPPRGRAFFPAAHGFMPFASGPFVATFVPMTTTGGTPFGSPTSHSALRSLHEMEIHAGEVAKMRAAHKAEMEHLDRVHQRVFSGMASSFQASGSASDLAQLKKSVDDLANRVNNIEKLLIIHDNLLKEGKK